MKLFDYSYYRIALFLKYKIKNWHNATVVLISLIQTSILTYPLITILKLNGQMRHISNVAIGGMILFILLSVVNEFRYSGMRIYEIKRKQNEDYKSSLSCLYGIIISVILVLVFFYAPILFMLTGAKLQ